jgi:hypothetical protein
MDPQADESPAPDSAEPTGEAGLGEPESDEDEFFADLKLGSEGVIEGVITYW